MRMARRDERLTVQIWQEPPTAEQLWGAMPDEMKALLPEEWRARKEWLFSLWALENGMSVIVSAFVQAVRQAEIDPKTLCVVSAVDCLVPIYETLPCDCFHVHQGRSIPFGIGLHLGNPSLKVVVLSDDSDILALGGNHVIHAARRNLDMIVVCLHEIALDGRDEQPPFNLPYLLSVCGAPYIVRWSVLHWNELRYSLTEAFYKRGFRFIEVLLPTLLTEEPSELLEALQAFEARTVIKHFAEPQMEGALTNEQIVLGKFVDTERLTFLDLVEREILSRF